MRTLGRRVALAVFLVFVTAPFQLQACEADLAEHTFAYTRLIAKAHANRELTTEDVRKIAQSGSPTNPFARRALTPGSIEYQKAVERTLGDARANWPAIQNQLRNLVDALERQKSDKRKTKDDTAPTFALRNIDMRHVKSELKFSETRLPRGLTLDSHGDLWFAYPSEELDQIEVTNLNTGEASPFGVQPSQLRSSITLLDWLKDADGTPVLRYVEGTANTFSIHTARLRGKASTRTIVRPEGASINPAARSSDNSQIVELHVISGARLFDLRTAQWVGPQSEWNLTSNEVAHLNGEPAFMTILHSEPSGTELFKNVAGEWQGAGPMDYGSDELTSAVAAIMLTPAKELWRARPVNLETIAIEKPLVSAWQPIFIALSGFGARGLRLHETPLGRTLLAFAESQGMDRTRLRVFDVTESPARELFEHTIESSAMVYIKWIDLWNGESALVFNDSNSLSILSANSGQKLFSEHIGLHAFTQLDIDHLDGRVFLTFANAADRVQILELMGVRSMERP